MGEGHFPPKIFKFLLLFILVNIMESQIDGNWSNYPVEIGENEQNQKKGGEMPLGKNYENGENIDKLANKNEGKVKERVDSLNELNSGKGLMELEEDGKNNKIQKEGQGRLNISNIHIRFIFYRFRHLA